MMYFDEYGVVVHHDGDQGDSCADTFRYYDALLYADRGLPVEVSSAYDFFFKNGIGCRHPKVPKYAKPFDSKFGFSRDQCRPAAIALSNYELMADAGQIKSYLANNRWIYPNGTDYAFPDHRSEFNPLNRSKVATACMVIASVFVVLQSWLDEKMCDVDQNHIHALCQAQKWKPTLGTKLASWIYKHRRNGPLWALRTFYNLDNPDIATMMEVPVRKYILGEP